jgi:hypothetical protein
MSNLIKNPLGEEIPEFMLANKNHTAKGAWHSNHCPASLGSSSGNTTAVGRATVEDIRTGWAGHLTTRQMKDQWSRFSGMPVGNYMDIYRDQLFNLQWSRTWQLRALKGWTPLAVLDLPFLSKIPPYHFQDVPNFGAPQFYLSKLFRPVKHFLVKALLMSHQITDNVILTRQKRWNKF